MDVQDIILYYIILYMICNYIIINYNIYSYATVLSTAPPDIANFRGGIFATPANAFSLGLLSGDSALLRALPMVVHPPLPVTLLELAHPSAMEQNET